MAKKIILAIILLGFLTGIIALVDYRKKWKAGYCFAENRLLTDNELVDVGVETLLKNLDREYQSLSPEEQATRIRYESLKDFYKRQPRCCGFSGDSGASIYPRPPSRILVKNGFLKKISYQFRTEGKKKFRTATVYISFCGNSSSVTGGRGKTIEDGKVVYHNWIEGIATDFDPNWVGNKSNIRRK